VTASADCPESFGYCDFAVGSFGIETPLKEGARRVISADWYTLKSKWEQQRWAYLFDAGLISREDADAWAAAVWPSEREAEEIKMGMPHRSGATSRSASLLVDSTKQEGARPRDPVRPTHPSKPSA
jgi:hypothetical protein